MNLLQLKYFQEVARYQNITKTAEILHISQPSLSTSIKHLEAELGIELFDRKGKSIVLNENGQNFLRDINSVFELLNRNQVKRDLFAIGKSSTISIGGRKSELMLSPFISSFLTKHPDVLISFKNSISVASFDPDILDFFIFAEPPESDPRGKLILDRERHSILMSKDHPLAKKSLVTLPMIAEEQFIFVTPNSEKMPPGYRLCQKEGFTPKVACITDERTVLLSIMKQSHLVSVVPEHDADAFMRIGDYVSFPVHTDQERNIVLSIPANKVLSKIAEEFLLDLWNQPEIRRWNPDWSIKSMVR